MDLVDRMIWTATHADHLRTGRQARRWLLALSRRMQAVERSPDGNAPTMQGAVATALEDARRVARRFKAPDPPPHLLDLREHDRNPWRAWEWVSWWSGMAKASATWAPAAGPGPRGLRAAFAAAVAAWRQR